MSDELFPSGPWTGFYQYGPRDKHAMDLSLAFNNGRMTGDGGDDVGRFTIKGRYDSSSRECFWMKTYPGSHVVFYWGYREGKGIWGRWEIAMDCHGGFHIWPRKQSEEAERSKVTEQQEVSEVIAAPTLAPREPKIPIPSASVLAAFGEPGGRAQAARFRGLTFRLRSGSPGRCRGVRSRPIPARC